MDMQKVINCSEAIHKINTKNFIFQFKFKVKSFRIKRICF
jgi:hypothetical protein